MAFGSLGSEGDGMSEQVIVALLSLVGGTGLVGAWIELIRTRRAVGQNGGSTLHDGVAELRSDVRAIRKTQAEQGERIAALEAKVG